MFFTKGEHGALPVNLLRRLFYMQVLKAVGKLL